MVAQVVSIFLLLLGRRYPILQWPGLAVLWVVVVLAFVSAIDYFRLFWRGTVKPASRAVAGEAPGMPEALPRPPHPGPLQ
jgi:hypothetical protein